MVAQKALFGAAAAMTGQEARVRLLSRITSTTSVTSLMKSLGKIGQVKWSLFLEDWDLGRVALSCHMATDLLRVG